MFSRLVGSDFVTPWTIAQQSSLSMEFFRKGYWSGLQFPSSGHLPDPGTEPASLASPAFAGRFFTTVPLGKPFHFIYSSVYVLIPNS